jgi:hypothetical protein
MWGETLGRKSAWIVALAGSGALVVGQLAPAAHATVVPFAAGTGIAQAEVAGFAPSTGGLSYTLSLGDAVANFEGQEAKSRAQEVGLGIYGALLSEVSVCGLPPAIKPGQLPQPSEVDSTHGAARASSGTSAGSAAGGDQHAEAEPTPAAHATTAVAAWVLPGLISLGSGTSRSDVTLVPGRRRLAGATVALQSVDLAGGLVHLGGLRWSAEQQTGDEPISRASFTVTSVTLAGVPLPTATTAQLTSTIATVDGLLAPYGLAIRLPSINRPTSSGIVRILPLAIVLGHSPALDPILQPLLAGLQPLRDLLNGATAKGTNCSDPRVLLGSALGPSQTVADIALAGLSPSGGLEIDLGGAAAGTGAASYSNPFGTAPEGPPPSGLQQTSPGATVPAGGPAASMRPTGTTATTGSSPRAPAVRAAVRLFCRTTSPANAPRCWRGAATSAGAGALLLSAALFAADVRRSRRANPTLESPA